MLAKKKSHTPTTTLTNILKRPSPYSQKIMIVLFVLNIEKKIFKKVVKRVLIFVFEAHFVLVCNITLL